MQRRLEQVDGRGFQSGLGKIKELFVWNKHKCDHKSIQENHWPNQNSSSLLSKSLTKHMKNKQEWTLEIKTIIFTVTRYFWLTFLLFQRKETMECQNNDKIKALVQQLLSQKLIWLMPGRQMMLYSTLKIKECSLLFHYLSDVSSLDLEPYLTSNCSNLAMLSLFVITLLESLRFVNFYWNNCSLDYLDGPN